MQRRSFLLGAAAVPALIAAGIPVAAQTRDKVLKFVPSGALSNLDPMWTTADLVARDHGHMVYDTLFGMTDSFEASPQMAEGYAFNADSTECRITLRQGLIFHDGSPVQAADCVASLRRWMAATGSLIGQHVAGVLVDLSAPDAQTILFRLSRPFPMLVNLMSSIVAPVPFIMPARIAEQAPSAEFRDTVGSGPFRFVLDQYQPGIRAVYERFDGYQPTGAPFEGMTSGPKVVHFDRVEWHAIPDSSTAFSALQSGEVDWISQTQPELLEVARLMPDLAVSKMESLARIGTLRFNHQNAPFNNKKLRQALVRAVNQQDFGVATVGNDPEAYIDGVGFFPPGTAMASTAGLEPLLAGPDLEEARRLIAGSGYAGEPLRVLGPTNISTLAAHAEVGIDLFRRLGLNVEPELVDWGTVVQKRTSRAPVAEGGWSVIFLIWPGPTMMSPATNTMLQGAGDKAPFGWPDIPRIEELRAQWFDAPDLAAQQTIAEEIQRVAMDELPYIPVSGIYTFTVARASLADRVVGFPIFWNIRPA